MPGISEGCHDLTGGTVGGQMLFRWQTGGWVFGVEAQGNWADLSGSNFSAFSALTDRTRMMHSASLPVKSAIHGKMCCFT